ncbi:MAG: hypothetical protein WBL45_05730 [Solirubrobacterales bacterium]
MTDGVDAGVEAMQPPSRRGSRHRAPRITERAGQLADRDDTVLALRQVGKLRMRA